MLVYLICQLVGKSSGVAWAMRWRMISAAGLSKCVDNSSSLVYEGSFSRSIKCLP
jgi:hypothetical protein